MIYSFNNFNKAKSQLLILGGLAALPLWGCHRAHRLSVDGDTQLPLVCPLEERSSLQKEDGASLSQRETDDQLLKGVVDNYIALLNALILCLEAEGGFCAYAKRAGNVFPLKVLLPLVGGVCGLGVTTGKLLHEYVYPYLYPIPSAIETFFDGGTISAQPDCIECHGDPVSRVCSFSGKFQNCTSFRFQMRHFRELFVDQFKTFHLLNISCPWSSSRPHKVPNVDAIYTLSSDNLFKAINICKDNLAKWGDVGDIPNGTTIESFWYCVNKYEAGCEEWMAWLGHASKWQTVVPAAVAGLCMGAVVVAGIGWYKSRGHILLPQLCNKLKKVRNKKNNAFVSGNHNCTHNYVNLKTSVYLLKNLNPCLTDLNNLLKADKSISGERRDKIGALNNTFRSLDDALEAYKTRLNSNRISVNELQGVINMFHMQWTEIINRCNGSV